MAKSEIRKEVLKARQAMTSVEIAEKSACIMKKLMSLEEYIKANIIMTYLDFRNEVQTEMLVTKAMSEGKQVVVPLTDLLNRKLVPSLLIDFPGDVAPGTWGILEPRPDCLRPVELSKIDLVIVPGVAFDLNGNRLGYGGGFYDRFLPLTRQDCVFVAPSFELQIRDNIYPSEHDFPVHYLITEKRIIKIA